jgi:hypothetical protein
MGASPHLEVPVRRSVNIAALVFAFTFGGIALATADSPPPTNGGNGAGQSGQCTGPQVDRPQSCQSQGGPGDQP